MSRILPLTAAEFFAGIGLVRLGLERQGWQVTFANDNDTRKFEMYSQNFPNAWDEFRVADIQALTGEDIPNVTLATASFPCNDLSLAGSYQGLQGRHSSTIWSFVRILNEMGRRRPPLIMLENVPSFLTSKAGNDFYSVIRALNDLGYVCDAFIVDAAKFVPQSRVRLFVIGISNELVPITNVNSLSLDDVRPKKLIDFIKLHSDLDWNIRSLPNLPHRAQTLSDVLEDFPHTSNIWWNEDRANYLLGQMNERHIGIVREMIRNDTFIYATAFRRIRNGRSMGEVRADGIAGCLRTPRGGSGRQILIKAGNGEFHVRLLSPRECARLQGAPDTYTIDVPLNQALFGFGDAVCVPVIEWIATNYLNPLIAERSHGYQEVVNG